VLGSSAPLKLGKLTIRVGLALKTVEKRGASASGSLDWISLGPF
jgi:hypothetical protein